MSFNTLARRVENTDLPLSHRHVALRSSVERFCPLGFQKTWQLLETRFNLKQGRESSTQSLLAAIEFLKLWRQAWLLRQASEAEFRRAEKRHRVRMAVATRHKGTTPSA